MGFSVVILAAGLGQRMHSNLAKVLHPIGGIAMVRHVIQTARSLNPDQIIIVYGHQGEELKASLADEPNLSFVAQKNPQGTGHAVLQALPLLKGDDKVLILYGDVPLIKQESLQRLIDDCQQKKAALGLITANVNPPTGFGRILRNEKHQILKIVEEKDANEAEKSITEINTGIYWVDSDKLLRWLPRLSADNVQQEYYLTDIISMALQEKLAIASVLLSSPTEALGINDKQQLARVERIYQLERANQLMQQGVTILDPARLDIRGNVKLGKDVTLDVNVILEGEITLEDSVKIGPNVIIKNSILQAGTEVLANCVIEGATIGPNSHIGPFARIRPDTITSEGVKIGNFVETKNANIGKGSKINHLSYVGDALLGQHVNVGAGTITCNYDGKEKHKTVIEDHVFIGSDTQLIAPVTIGAGSIIGAGTTVTKNVPSNHLIHNQIQHRSVAKEK